MAAKSWPHDTLGGEPGSARGIISQRLTRHFGTQKIAHEQEKLLTALVLVAATASAVTIPRIEHVETSDRVPTRCRPVHFGARIFRVLRSNGIATASATRTRSDAAARSSAPDRMGSLSGVADEGRRRTATRTGRRSRLGGALGVELESRVPLRSRHTRRCDHDREAHARVSAQARGRDRAHQQGHRVRPDQFLRAAWLSALAGHSISSRVHRHARPRRGCRAKR